MRKRYHVQLSDTDRHSLQKLVRSGNAVSARRWQHEPPLAMSHRYIVH